MGLAAQLGRLMPGAKARLFGRGDPAAAPTNGRGGLTYLRALDAGSAKRLRNYSSYLGAITIPDVYKCASLIANTFCATPLRILDDDDKEIDLKDHSPELDAIMKRPNPEMRSRQFRQTLSHHYQLTGNAIVLKDNYDGLGRPTELWPLRPDKVHILRSDVGKLAYGYEVSEGSGGKTRLEWYPGESVLHARLAHPSDSLFGLGVIEAGEQAFSRGRLVNEFCLNFFSRGGIVDGVLTTPNEIPEEERLAILADWKAMKGSGGRNTLRTALLWAGASYTPIEEPLGRVPVIDLTRMSLEDIAQLFGIPLQLLGGAGFSDSNYRNAQEAVQFFYGETMAPQQAQFEEDFWNPLLEDFDPSLRAEYEQREVIDYQMRADAAAKLAATGAFSINDIHVAAGYDPLPDDDDLGAMIPLPKGMTLLSPEQALALGEEVQEAPEELPPAPRVTEVGAQAGGAQAQGTAAGAGTQEQQGQQAAGGAEKAQEQRGGKSGDRTMRGQKTYPAALLSPQARAEQRRRALRQDASSGRAGAPPHLRLLPGAKAPAQADASDAAPCPAVPGARAAPGPPRPAAGTPLAGSGEVDAAVGPSTGGKAGARTVSVRPTDRERERIACAYQQCAEQEDDAAWQEVSAGAPDAEA